MSDQLQQLLDMQTQIFNTIGQVATDVQALLDKAATGQDLTPEIASAQESLDALNALKTKLEPTPAPAPTPAPETVTDGSGTDVQPQ